MEIRRNSGVPGRTRSMLNTKSDASELNTPSTNRECFLSCLSRWQMMKTTVLAITAITTTDGWILQCYFLFYHKQPQKWSLAFVILLARNWTFSSSSAGLPSAVSHTLLSLYGVLQGGWIPLCDLVPEHWPLWFLSSPEAGISLHSVAG